MSRRKVHLVFANVLERQLVWRDAVHHPHVHCIVPGGGVSPEGAPWVPNRSNFFLSVRVLSRLFRRLLLEGIERLCMEGELQFVNDLVTRKPAA